MPLKPTYNHGLGINKPPVNYKSLFTNADALIDVQVYEGQNWHITKTTGNDIVTIYHIIAVLE